MAQDLYSISNVVHEVTAKSIYSLVKEREEFAIKESQFCA